VDPRPFDELHFKNYGTNPFLDTEDDHLSTFGLDVDTASYTVVRNFLERGVLPPQDAVRVEEMVNYFDYRDPSPRRGDFALGGEGAPSPFAHGEDYYLLRLHVAAREVAEHQRPPAQLVFVVDVSGSMNRENRLGLVRQALHMLVDRLRPDDTIGLVVYGSRGEVILHPTSDKNAIRHALDRLRPSGSTNAEEGLVLAYELAERYRRAGAIQRLILCSDGVANVGATEAEDILRNVSRRAEDGIELTTVGFGMGNYNDVLMEQLADRGDGRYAYVDSLDEAHRIFVEDLTGTLFTVASEARAQVDFDPRHVARYRLLGYENRDIEDHRFRDDTVDAGEIGAGHRVTVLYEIKLRDDLPRRTRRRDDLHLATLRLRYRSEATGRFEELAHAITGADLVEQLEESSPALRLAAVVAETAEVLRGSYWARGSNLDEVFRSAQRVSREFEGDREVAELVSLVGKAASTMERERQRR
jgi:Ca-activated chloride channel family protein